MIGAEAPYLAKQLGHVEAGQSRLVHPSTLRSLRRRGFVDARGLTPLGRLMLMQARGEIARPPP